MLSISQWARTGAAIGRVLGALVTYDVVQRVAIRFGSRVHQRAVSRMAAAINHGVTLTGARFDVRGLEHVDPKKNYLVVMNHQSLVDISMASDFLRAWEPRYVSKIELAKGVPGVSYNLTRGGSALVDRKNPAQAHKALEEIGRRMKDERFTVVIFPEGTRSKTGAMKAFHASGLRTLVRAAPGVAILPVTSFGGSLLFRRGLTPLERDVTMGFHVHAPVAAPSPDDADAFAAFVRDLEATIASGLPERDREGKVEARAKKSRPRPADARAGASP